MTVRAVILGLLGAAFLAGACYLNDWLLQNTPMIGNHLPIGVFGMLMAAAIAVNPALGLLHARWRLRPAELGVVTALMLAACSIPGSGLMRTFTPTLLMPLHYDQQRPEWRTHDILGYLPPQMIPGRGRHDPVLVEGFLNGLPRDQDAAIGIADVPWRQWARPLAVWMPLVFLLAGAGICLSLIVHRQWALREHLRYPIADFAASLMSGRDEAGGSIFGRKIFWIGLGVVLAVRLVNGLAAYYPHSIKVPLVFSFRPILQTFPALRRLPGIGYLVTLRIYPTGVAFGFLLASQVSLSLGVAPVLLAAGSAVLLSAGVDVTGGYFTGGVMHWQKFGSYLGLTLLLIYTGRRYYGQVLKRALAFLPAPEADAAAVWACRFLILAVAAMVFLLARAGLDWPLGLLAVCTFLMMFLVMARINAESGLFYLQPYWQPMMLFLGLFGFAALGPRTVALLALLCAVFTIDPRECLMPFVVNALRICDRLAIRPAGVGWASAGVFALALAVAVPLVLWANYNYGMFTNDTWAADRVPNMTYQVVERSVTTLTPAEREQADRRTAWSRLRAMRPNRRFLVAAGAGVGLVLLLSALRLRLARFPLHPIMFLVWGTYPLGLFSHSFLLGWLIKRAVTRYGGGHAVYRKATAFMFGVVAGDLLGGLIFMAVGALYYAVTGFAGPEYRIFPS